MKTRMTNDDIRCMVHNLKKQLLGMRLSNIYNLSLASSSLTDGASIDAPSDQHDNKTYILKFNLPPSLKKYCLIESGIRFHTTKYHREKPTRPSQFTMKLRKHLKTKRLVNIQQLNGDRIIDFVFSSGKEIYAADEGLDDSTENTEQVEIKSEKDDGSASKCYTFHIILELYASGNIILTDSEYMILSLLRTHRYNEDVKVAAKHYYPIHMVSNGASPVGKDSDSNPPPAPTTPIDPIAKLGELIQEAIFQYTGKKKKTLKQIILLKSSGYEHLGPTIIEHCILLSGLDASSKKSTFDDELKQKIPLLHEQLIKGNELLLSIESKEEVVKGYITMEHTDNDPDGNKEELYDEFVPMLYKQHESRSYQEFETFDDAVDEFFSKVETQVAEERKKAAKKTASNKVEKIQADQNKRVEALQETQKEVLRHASLIELNQIDVDNVLMVLRSAIDNGMNWEELHDLVKMEQENGNPIASLIHELKLDKNRVALLLSDEENCDGHDLVDLVEVDISMSALANARELYSSKKLSAIKEMKTVEASKKALEAAEKKSQQASKKQDLKRTIHVMRKIFWFEKFNWFISSENYLILCGKDAQQNELLVKRYLRKNDIYVHADIHGAATCIVRNRNDRMNQPIPQLTLEQAGTMTICRSAAWESQIVIGAWYVGADQVSKTAPSGEYLTTGSFMIRGKKTFIQPGRLEMGLAIFFQVDEISMQNHKDERIPRDELYKDEVFEEVHTDDEKRIRKFERTRIKKQQAAEEEMMEMIEKTIGTGIVSDEEKEEKINLAKEEQEDTNELTTQGDIMKDSENRRDVEDEDEYDSGNENTKDKSLMIEKPTKKRVSAKERRNQKKESSNDKQVDQTQLPPKIKVVEKELTRGQRRKQKIIKKKYADQDEEDRLLRIRALGNCDDYIFNHDSSLKESSTQKYDIESETRKEVVETEKKKRIESLATRKQLEEEQLIHLAEEEQMEVWDAFTGNPLSEDKLISAIAVCAPFTALSNYKFRAKLTPGTQKKGKASKQVLELFLRSSMILPREKDLMKCITDNELVACMLGPVKVSAAGLFAVANAMKKAKSKKK